MAKRFYEDQDMTNKLAQADRNLVGNATGPANLPQNVIFKTFQKTSTGGKEGLDDTMTGIDAQIAADLKGYRKNKR